MPAHRIVVIPLSFGVVVGACVVINENGDDTDTGPDADTSSETAPSTTSDDTSAGPTETMGTSDTATDGTTSDASSGDTGNDSDSTTGTGSDSSGTGSGGSTTGTGASSSTSSQDLVAPTIIETFPADGGAGVLKGTTVKVVFSEAMDSASVEAAFGSADLPGATFSWSSGLTEMTIIPAADFEYASAIYPAALPAANEYAYTISTGATDEAGNPLATQLWVSFTSLREYAGTLSTYVAGSFDDRNMSGTILSDGEVQAAQPIFVGDNPDNDTSRGFISVSLGTLKTNLQGTSGATIVSATFRAGTSTVIGAPYASLGGQIRADHVSFAAMAPGAFNTPTLHALGVFADDDTPQERTVDATVALVDDLDADRDWSQYRLLFATGTDGDGATDRVSVSGASGSSAAHVDFELQVP